MNLATASRNDVLRALRAERPSTDDVAALLSPAAGELLPEVAARARELTIRHFGRSVQLYAPLYVSNACENACAYCGFSARNRVERRTLTPAQIALEADELRRRGFRHVLLVSGEAPSAFGLDALEDAVRIAAERFSSVSIEVFPLDADGYRRMVAAGADGLALYQETYDRGLYAELHPAGRKRDFDARLAAPAVAAEAGMRRVWLGSLLGLRDFRSDALHAIVHAREVARADWRVHVGISFPRLRPAEGGFAPPAPVSDRELVQIVCATRIALPRAGLALSTREPAALRDALLGVGITNVSAGSCTEPGGYVCYPSDGPAPAQQFTVDDDRSPAEVCAAIRAAGFDPVWKDWDAGFREPE